MTVRENHMAGILLFLSPWPGNRLHLWFGWEITGIPGKRIMEVPGASGTGQAMIVHNRH